MSQYAEIMSDYEYLRGDDSLITESGWAELASYYEQEQSPAYGVIEDFFTVDTESIIHGESRPLHDPRILSLVGFLAKLSNPYEPEPRVFQDIEPRAGGTPLHVDVQSGDTFHGNFIPLPNSRYEIYTTPSNVPHSYIELYDDDEYRIKIDPKQKIIVPITNRQLFIVQGDAVSAIHVETEDEHETSVPHAAIIPRAINVGRTMLTVYAERRNAQPWSLSVLQSK